MLVRNGMDHELGVMDTTSERTCMNCGVYIDEMDEVDLERVIYIF